MSLGVHLLSFSNYLGQKAENRKFLTVFLSLCSPSCVPHFVFPLLCSPFCVSPPVFPFLCSSSCVPFPVLLFPCSPSCVPFYLLPGGHDMSFFALPCFSHHDGIKELLSPWAQRNKLLTGIWVIWKSLLYMIWWQIRIFLPKRWKILGWR